MRVLMATMKLDIGGAETHIVELSKALARRGVEVIVASNGGAYETELAEAGIEHIKIPFHSKNPVCMKRAYQMLKKVIFEKNIDVVHAHARIPAFLCGMLHNKYHFRFVTTAHWVFTTKFPYNLLTRWGDRSLAVSDDIKKYLIDNYGIDKDNIRVTINGIDLEKFSKDTDYSDVATEFGLTDDKTRIVYVSRMDIDRSLAAHKLLEAAESLAKEIPNLEIVIVGGGNDFETVRAEAEAVNAAMGRRMVIVTGSRTDINKFAASGDIFIGVSRAALEAMACEKPAIIAGNEGYIGIFDEDKLQVSIDTNFCCRGCGETTTEQLKKDILKVLKAPIEEQERLGRYSRETVGKYYSIKTMADDAMKMYVSIIKNSMINEVAEEEFLNIDDYLMTNPIRTPGGKIDVMISGYYGFHNSGDDSILKAIVDSLSISNPDIKILALSNDPAETKAVYGIDAIHRLNIIKILWNMRKTKLLISGGGSLIQDVTSDKSLIYYLGIIYIAKMMGAKVMLYANGIGPITNENNHKSINKVLNSVDLITLRENSSVEELRKFEIDKPEIIVTADPAFNLVEAGEEETTAFLKKIENINPDNFCVISVRPWMYTANDFEENIAYIADYIKSKYNTDVLFIPMQITRDLEISQSICKKMKEKGAVTENELTPQQILGIVKKAKFVIGMRLHMLIYAAKTGTPVIGLTYDPKVEAAMEYIGQELTEDVLSTNPLTLCRYIDKIFEENISMREELSKVSLELEKKAAENTKLAIELLEE